MGITEDQFGTFRNQPVLRYTLTNKHNVTVQLITYGATITTISVPDKNGKCDDVVLGFDDMDGYLTKTNPYFGATIGRVANRIANSKFTLDGKIYSVSQNLGKHHLHGGFIGFDKVIWNAEVVENKVNFTYVSKDGEEGYPGEVKVTVIYELAENNELVIEIQATASKSTPVNICNHSYFNLAGHNGGADELYKHIVKFSSSKYTPSDVDSIPVGRIDSVSGTPFDLQYDTVLGPAIQAVDLHDKKGGFDHNFCVDESPNRLNHVARVHHPPSGRVLEVYSDQPGVQFYTSNFLPVQPDKIIGKHGVCYNRHGALCLETQQYPDSVNHENFPDSILKPRYNYNHTVIYKFANLS